MDSNKIITLVHTIKYLKPIQIYYRLYYFVRNRFFKKSYNKPLSTKDFAITRENDVPTINAYLGNNTFSFLNLEKKFEYKIDWNYSDFGKLWTFNLNYFDFLNQQEITAEQGMALILDYIENEEILTDGKASYTISLRGMNWIKFLSKNNINNQVINQALYNHFQILVNNPEYHLLGNHLLENGFALLFGGYYFKDEQLYKEAKKILVKELEEQLLQDGGHFELSTMYHQTMLVRVLDCVQLLQLNDWKNRELLAFLKEKATKMLSWLQEVTFNNGDIPMVNDSTYGIAPTSKELFDYARALNIAFKKGTLSDSGYRMFKNNDYELFVDVGRVGASYQPAHVHSDTFNFVLQVKGEPIIVDRGITTYEKNKIRQEERGTAAHNTVQIGGAEQTQVWGGFRVAERAKVVQLVEGKNFVEASHDGYKWLHCIHTRKFEVGEEEITIADVLKMNTSHEKLAFLHFHPHVKDIEIENNKVKLIDKNIAIVLNGNGALKIEKEDYPFSLGFNKTEQAISVKITFDENLETIIKL